MILMGHLMKMPGPPPHDVPGGDIAGVSSRCLRAFSFEQFRFYGTRYAFCIDYCRRRFLTRCLDERREG